MKIHTTINMCEQKCISEQYSNRANWFKREIEGILKNVHVYLENSHFKSLWSNRYQQFTKSRRFLSLVHDLLGIISPHHFVAIFDLHQAHVIYVTNIHS